MRVILCDVNYFLDIFLKREPFYESAAKLFTMVEKVKVKGYACSLTFPVLFYLLSKEIGRIQTVKTLERVRIVFKVATVDERVIDLSLVSDFKDFEDAVQYYSALDVGVNYIISRNKGDFPYRKIPVLTSDEFLAINKHL